MLLGIEIGGTKLQLGVGRGRGEPLAELRRYDIDRGKGAECIREQILAAATELMDAHPLTAVGIGFGGPVNAFTGRTVTSHQIAGWDDFPIVQWLRDATNLPVALANDADIAGLAEARFGAGREHRVVFYITVGSGIGGALLLDGQIYYGGHGIAGELGHLRPGLTATEAEQTVEAVASGFGIAAQTQARLREHVAQPIEPLLREGRPKSRAALRQRLANYTDQEREAAGDLIQRAGGEIDRITAKLVGQAAAEGNPLAGEVVAHAIETLGWALAQMITLLAPEVIVIGGGVACMGDDLFFVPLRAAVDRYVFPPLRGNYRVVPCRLGDAVVIHGALALAAEMSAGVTR